MNDDQDPTFDLLVALNDLARKFGYPSVWRDQAEVPPPLTGWRAILNRRRTPKESK